MIVALKTSKVEAWRRTGQEPSRQTLAGTWSPGWRRSGFDLKLEICIGLRSDHCLPMSVTH